MGPDLADGRPVFGASGAEWRTPPLWGIGLYEVVNKHNRLLHDGRRLHLHDRRREDDRRRLLLDSLKWTYDLNHLNSANAVSGNYVSCATACVRGSRSLQSMD